MSQTHKTALRDAKVVQLSEQKLCKLQKGQDKGQSASKIHPPQSTALDSKARCKNTALNFTL